MIRMTVAIIGTAGRRGDLRNLNLNIYRKMVKKARAVITEDWKLPWNKVELVSGGAAWADHVAVTLHCMYPDSTLKLYLPCAWDFETKTFQDDGTRDWRKNPGGTSNFYHRVFSERLAGTTLDTLNTVLQQSNTKHQVIPGFKARNNGPASCDYLLAFTWGEGDVPKDGGTKDTWDKAKLFKGTQLHVPLISLM